MYYIISGAKFGGSAFEMSFEGECAVQCYAKVFGVAIVVYSVSVESYVWLSASMFIVEVETRRFCFAGVRF